MSNKVKLVMGILLVGCLFGSILMYGPYRKSIALDALYARLEKENIYKNEITITNKIRDYKIAGGGYSFYFEIKNDKKIIEHFIFMKEEA
ncbi:MULTISPECIES: hypothetical protein [Carnobacterium]|uniref:hypothetical protein n=1 Tax=Carnobacterium TaxID=2747 RepID=UPI00288CFBBA|nr:MULTISPECIES: hypothetical protein [Carnobacterium]MDT1939419.1 hypothetical protein [Carnobacterium divergens]MDT1941857.1 hypothetical protein [Carnobacterium divergens]MDT1947655.1 hypothetical protein [Carnobacterium divergens]MDT1950142.1 hypothetical protein [Carnobacterium divergens]MDT1955320.1 hypothetical protein [Carnobacterium divergens]